MLSVGVAECPGAANAAPRATCAWPRRPGTGPAKADVVIVNTHLYATHLAAGGAVLPAHDVVIFDEAHELEDVASSSLGLEIGAGRFAALARIARPLVSDASRPRQHSTTPGTLLERQPSPTSSAGACTVRCRSTLDHAPCVHAAASAVTRLSGALRERATATSARKARAQQAAGHLAGDLDQIMALPSTHVAWVEGPARPVSSRWRPIEVGAVLAELLWTGRGRARPRC